MSISLAELRFLLERMRGLVRRGMASLRTRGWRTTWQRVQRQFEQRPRLPASALYLPTPAPFSPFALPCAESPLASIIIPVFNQVQHTLICLRALAEHLPAASLEVIVVDDGSGDDTESWMRQISGLRYHRRVANGGFIAACNDGASLARGQYLVFLNNDTVPQPGWLDALLDTFHQHPGTGLAGAQLIYPDGRLQEAGGVVFGDGSAWNYGRFDSPDDPRYAYLRDADYCSGAAIAIPAALFHQLGGFDTRYAPAYYEDTDLAFSVRAAGLRVLYQPAARVVHLEGVSSGTDTASGTKAYQLRNRERFEAKWRQVLAAHAPASSIPDASFLHGQQRQILIIDAQTPRPDHDSGSLRLFNLMRLLREEGAHVLFLPADLNHAGPYTRALQQLGVEAWHAPFVGRVSEFLRKHGQRFDCILLSRHHLASAMLPLVKQHAPQARIIFDTVDLHYLRETRGADIAGNASLKLAAEKTRQRELAVIAKSDVTVVVSAMEKELLTHDARAARVEVISNLHQPAGTGLPFQQRRDLVFVGGFGHPPNTDAAIWFITEIFPRIRQQLPEVEFHCIGNQPPAEILALARQPGVHVHGYVQDLLPYMEGKRIAVAPLRFGAGVKGKINLSMAHGQPVVATSCAAEGMHLQDGHDVRVADGADAFANAVIRLYRDEVLWNTLSQHGLSNVQTHFSLDAARQVARRVFF